MEEFKSGVSSITSRSGFLDRLRKECRHVRLRGAEGDGGAAVGGDADQARAGPSLICPPSLGSLESLGSCWIIEPDVVTDLERGGGVLHEYSRVGNRGTTRKRGRTSLQKPAGALPPL